MMDFAFTEEQEELRVEARRFLERNSPVQRARDAYDGRRPETDVDLAAQGWTGLGIPEADGGFGDFLDLVVVLEELGRYLVPGPFASTLSIAVPALVTAPESRERTRLLERVASGEGGVALAWDEGSGTWPSAGYSVRARADGDELVVGGRKVFVLDAADAGEMLVAATAADGETLLLAVRPDAAGVGIRSMRALDATRPLFEVAFEDVRVPAGSILARGAEAEHALSRARSAGLVGQCAELIGTMAEVLDRSVAYAKDRVQFGKPIGSYQGVSHTLAQMLLLVENSRSAVYYAAWTVSTEASDAERAASVAKAFVADAARWVTSFGIQVHGGIGFTWEHDMHLYFKRAKGYEVLLGDATLHRDLVARTALSA